MTVLIFIIVSYFLMCFALSTLFKKANVESWKAYVPGVNFIEWCTLIGQPKWWAALLLLPIVNIFIFCGMCVDLVRSFGKYTLGDSALAVIYSPLKFWLIGNNDADKYIGPTIQAEEAYINKIKTAHEQGKNSQVQKLILNNPYKKSVAREWTEAIVFAVFAASFIRMFLIEAYVIPTSSMEGSLKVGDYLFVSKAHYGIRTPQTLLQLPLLHNVIPIINKESYLKQPSLPYYRLPALTKIKRNDPVVFNWPIGDRVYITPARSYNEEQVKRRNLNVNNARFVDRPMDKTDFYIKRCVAIAGDSLEIKNRQIYINGEASENPDNIQFLHSISLPSSASKKQIDDLDIYPGDIGNKNLAHMNQTQVDKLRALGAKVEVINARNEGKDILFPNDSEHFHFQSIDNFGPIWIPKKGATTPLTLSNLSMFRRIIETYEHHKLEVKGNNIFIDDIKSDSYTFGQDYYWMMGDNRHNSEDSRYWGFVPFDHVVGKPLFIWMSSKFGSMKNGIRWDRIFNGATKMKK